MHDSARSCLESCAQLIHLNLQLHSTLSANDFQYTALRTYKFKCALNYPSCFADI